MRTLRTPARARSGRRGSPHRLDRGALPRRRPGHAGNETLVKTSASM